MSEASPPWERRPGESARSHSAFLRFRDQGPHRSLAAAYRQETGKEQAKQASGEWNGWYTAHEWRARAESWDEHLAARAREVAEAEHVARITAHRERAAKIGATTADVANVFLWKAAERLRALSADDIPVRSLPAFLRAAAAIAQVSLSIEAEALGVRELETLLSAPDEDRAEDR